jgi:hypothetical protein
MYDLNPLDVLKQREVKTLPPHFAKCKLPNDILLFDEDFNGWIRTKLKGRFCITRVPAINESGHLKSSTVIAFEDQKELTYFMLACPYLRRN